MSSSPSTDDALLLLLRAPSRDAIGLLLNAAFRCRHDPNSLTLSAALTSFTLSPEEGSRLAVGTMELLRRVLYESSELLTAAAIDAKIPQAVDVQLRKFLTTVRSLCSRETPVSYFHIIIIIINTTLPSSPTLTHHKQFILSSLPAWREGAIESRVSLPRLESTSWRVDTASGSANLASASEPLLRLSLNVRASPTETNTIPPLENIDITIPPAALGVLIEGMRRVRDQLSLLQGP